MEYYYDTCNLYVELYRLEIIGAHVIEDNFGMYGKLVIRYLETR